MRTWLVVVALLGAVAQRGSAQDTHSLLPRLPDSVAQRVIDFYNAAGTVRLGGDTRVAAGASLTGDVAALGARIDVAGRIAGAIVVINGVLHLEDGGVVTGPVTVVGGSITGDRTGLRGSVDVHAAPLRYRQIGAVLVFRPEPRPPLRAVHRFGGSELDLHLAAGDGYNRVEGLPIVFGPRLRLGRRAPVVVEALAVYRSAAGLRIDPERMGYAVRAERQTGGNIETRVGALLFSEVAPIESGGLSTLENSLATFVLHRDYRDHYDRTGWHGFVRVTPTGTAVVLSLEYRDERHATAPLGSPWSLFDSQSAWRPQPLVAEGTLRSIAARLEYDTRNDSYDPATGWHVRAELEQALGSSLRRADDESGQTLPRFRTGSVDARRYVRLSPYARVAIRAVATGTLDAGELPPQRQHALGGEGSLPGYASFAFDCGARERIVLVEGETFFPYYGCDRAALVQLEYQANFPFGRRMTERIGGLDAFAHSVRWVAFFNAGRAWTEPSARGNRRGGEDFSADAGLGLRIGRFGLYWAVPLSRGEDGANFFVRLEPRL
jgi:hypothetical protein